MSEKESHVLNVYMNRKHPSIVKAEGIYLYDDGGKRYIDSAGGPVLCNLGHGLDEMADVLSDQAKKVAYAYRFEFTTPILEEAADKVCRVSNGVLDKVFFVSGGSEATEIAAKLARKYHIDNGEPSRFKIISRWLSYHGMTAGALSWSGMTARRAEFVPMLNDFSHIAPGYCYRCWFNRTPETCNLECATALENEIMCQGPETVAAFIAEPLSGMSLVAAHPREDYFPKIREICDRFGVLLILDEVMTGFGRTGKFYAFEHFGIKPDIVALGKGLGGGYFPIGAAAVTKKVSETIAKKSGVFGAGFTWAGNPMGAAVVSKTVDYLEEHNLVERSAKMGDYLAEKLETLRSHPSVGDIRGKGLMQGIEFVKDKETKEVIDPRFMFWIQLAQVGLQNGIFLETSSGCNRGQGGDLLMFGPPFIITEEQIDEMIEVFDKVLGIVEKNSGF